jgi:hypothetical protein
MFLSEGSIHEGAIGRTMIVDVADSIGIMASVSGHGCRVGRVIL